MQIALSTLAQAIAPESAAPPAEGSAGFEATLKSQQTTNQPPPGPEPPDKASPPGAQNAKGGEVAKTEPNAPSQRPDSQPSSTDDKKSEKSVKRSDPPAQQPSISPPPVPTLLAAAAGAATLQNVPSAEPTPAAQAAVPVVLEATPIGNPGPLMSGNHMHVPEADTPASVQQQAAPAPAASKSAPGPSVPIDPMIAKELNVKQVVMSSSDDKTVLRREAKTTVSSPSASSDPKPQKAEAPAASADPNSGEGGQPSGGGSPSDQQQEPALSDPAQNVQGTKAISSAADASSAQAAQTQGVVATRATTSAQPAEAGTSLTPAKTAQIVQQTSDRIALLAATHSKEAVTVHLSPPDLGDLTIVVKATGFKVDAEITATNDSVKAALQQHAGQLGASLSQRGLELNSVSVGAQGNFTTQGESQARQGAQAHQNASNRATESVSRDDLNNKTAVPASSPGTAQGVDLRI